MGAVNLRKTHLIFRLETTFLQIMGMVVVGHSTERHRISLQSLLTATACMTQTSL